ncbi:substrate-binding domain-containing protein [Sessilibacter sp. MAH1]
MLKKILAVLLATLSLCASLVPYQALAQTQSSKPNLLFKMTGSNTIGAQLAPELVKAFLEEKEFIQVRIEPSKIDNEYTVLALNPSTGQYSSVEIAAHGSSTGFKALQNLKTDIAMASRSIKESELQALRVLGDLESFESEHVIAIDGLAIIVHPKNPINELTITQIAEIFSGKINNWSQVGGKDQPISIHARDNQSGTWDTFKSLVLMDDYTLSNNALRYESNDQLSAMVARNEYAIGFVGLASVNKAKALGVSDHETNSIPPQQITVATEDYPLSRRLFLYTPQTQQKSIVKEFLNFVQSTRGQLIVGDIGFVSQTPIAIHVDKHQGPDDYLKITENAQRLSVNIRFNEGSSLLDNKAKHDIQRLVDLMSLPEYQNKELLLVGFGDAKQTPTRATVLSKLRAIAVKSRLHENGIQVAPVTGFGHFNPVVSNDGERKLKNQRVEVWLI